MRRSPKPLRIEIASLGRFHVLDLARELDARGHHVRFHSYVPKRRAKKFGLPAHCHVAMLPWLAPFVALVRLCGGTTFAAGATRLLEGAADVLVSLRLQSCDVFIAMSGMYVRAPLRARRKFGAKFVVERGSVHIEAQKDILDCIRQLNPRASTVPEANVVREKRNYATADKIVIPSRHAEASFLARGFPPSVLFRNPYGVDLSMFSADSEVCRDPKVVIFVGAWTYRKGVDILTSAMLHLSTKDYRLFHIGPCGDAPTPNAKWFTSVGVVDQIDLPDWYRRARCLVLPSREDGFGLVLLQALASGCPVIGSAMTGAADLKQGVGLREMVQVVPVGNVTALVDAVSNCDPHLKTATLGAQARVDLSWQDYGSRYELMLGDLARQTST